MAINQNHPFEDIEGIKCAVVEKNLTKERLEFLKEILAFNGYEVVVGPTPPAKAAATAEAEPASQMSPSTFTLGVTDVTFNVTNAIFGRLLKSPEGNIITLAFWNGMEKSPDDSVPYFEKKIGRKK